MKLFLLREGTAKRSALLGIYKANSPSDLQNTLLKLPKFCTGPNIDPENPQPEEEPAIFALDISESLQSVEMVGRLRQPSKIYIASSFLDKKTIEFACNSNDWFEVGLRVARVSA